MNTTTERATSGTDVQITRVEPEWKLPLAALVVGTVLGWSLHGNWASLRPEPKSPAKSIQTALRPGPPTFGT